MPHRIQQLVLRGLDVDTYLKIFTDLLGEALWLWEDEPNGLPPVLGELIKAHLARKILIERGTVNFIAQRLHLVPIDQPKGQDVIRLCFAWAPHWTSIYFQYHASTDTYLASISCDPDPTGLQYDLEDLPILEVCTPYAQNIVVHGIGDEGRPFSMPFNVYASSKGAPYVSEQR